MMELTKSLGEIRSGKTFDEMSMERSKSFVAALQELKNLQPQLYSAAEYCEKSFLNSDEKQVVLENVKDYTVRALVNAIDHLGTVASKLSDVMEQHALDISSMELKVTRLNQQLLTCRRYTDREGLRQQQLLAIIPRHHKHYILPMNKKVHFSPHVQTDPRHPLPNISQSGAAPSAKTLLWHLASETTSTLRIAPHEKPSGAFNFLETEDAWMKSTVPLQKHSTATKRETQEGYKPLSPYRSFGHFTEPEMARAPRARSKGVISAFFVKQRAQKQKT